MIQHIPDDKRDSLIAYLSGLLTKHRQSRIRKVPGKRTRHLTEVPEDIPYGWVH